jgi:glycosyltransferase involved in cell wall biosynthesis
MMATVFRQLEKDYDIFLLTPYNGKEGKIELPKHVTHVRISDNNFNYNFDYTALTYGFLLDIDIVIGVMNLWAGMLDLYKLCSGTKLRTIASNNEMYFYPYQNPVYYGMINDLLESFSSVDAVVWPTNFSASVYGLASDNSYLLPNPNTYKVSNYSKLNSNKVVLSVGRFNDYIKRVDRILKSFSIVLKNEPDAQLILVGKCDIDKPIKPGESTTINDLMIFLGLNERNVTFVGEVNNVEEYYKQATLLLVASKSEGFGMVISEAATFGVPVVCTQIPGLEDLIIDGYNGFFVTQDNDSLMAEKILTILTKPKLRESMSRNALQNIAKFDEEIIGDKWRYLINTIIENKQKNILRKKLNLKLSFNVNDYKDFSSKIFAELNIIISSNLEMNQISAPPPNTLSFLSAALRSDFKRTNSAVKKYGYIGALSKIAKKIYFKIK